MIRKLFLFLIVIGTGLILICRLYYLQIYDVSATSMSENNAIKAVYDYPQRGRIYDRNNKLLVTNQPSYDLMAIPKEIKKFDTLALCKLLSINKAQLLKQLHRARKYSPRLPSPIVSTMTKDEFALLGEQMRKFEGFYIQKRSLRDYQIDFGANFLGYLAQVHNGEIKKDPYYKLGDLVGKQGVEKSYEQLLRGTKGVKYLQKDIFNRTIGEYKDGALDVSPQPGSDIRLTIDAELQEYAELLLKNKRGGIVALEPKTGEILTLATGPNFNPSLLVGRKRSANYTILDQDTINKPLYDRSLIGAYAPGSPFKALTALIGLQEGIINIKENVYCKGSYYYGGKKPLGCHHHKSPVNLISGLAHSCNSYFATLYRKSIDKYDTPKKGIDNWKRHLQSFGLGNYMGYDLPIGNKGHIPDANYYDRIYKSFWGSTTTISNAIGQGEVLMTPMQMAHFTATIANKGFYYRPHIIKSIVGTDSIPKKYTVKHNTTINPKHFEPVIQGMNDVYNYGTASFLKVPGIEICGKTGTAENYAKMNDGKVLQLTDHSVFVAFAPKENPKIAISVFVENGYWGARYGGRIASLLIEKYLKREVTRKDLENWVLEHSLEDEYAKPLNYDGTPFSINN